MFQKRLILQYVNEQIKKKISKKTTEIISEFRLKSVVRNESFSPSTLKPK